MNFPPSGCKDVAGENSGTSLLAPLVTTWTAGSEIKRVRPITALPAEYTWNAGCDEGTMRTGFDRINNSSQRSGANIELYLFVLAADTTLGTLYHCPSSFTYFNLSMRYKMRINLATVEDM